MSLNLKECPIFVLGAERSGTTLLMAMLGFHKRLAVPEVVWYYPRFRPYLHTYGDLGDAKNFRTLASEMVFGLKTPFWGLPVNPATIVDEIIARAETQTFEGLFAALLGKYAEHVGKPRWGEKTPYNLFFVKEILEDFPNAQFIFITRDGRDASADYLESSFGPTNIHAAAYVWKRSQNAVEEWREKLPKDQWLDVSYEALVHDPEGVLRGVTDFLGEEYDPGMLKFHEGEIAQKRGQQRDHAPLGGPASTQYIGIYKNLLSLRDQRIFAWVAGRELENAGYKNDVEPLALSDAEVERYRELDGRTRAATIDAEDGHIVYESYNDWLVDQREERRRAGLWSKDTAPRHFPLGHADEELVTGQRAPRRWKEYLGIKRRYVSDRVVL
ncbi:MAG: sulfotransferase [Rhodocyclaceae bacterium]|nr:sulfotransferase [Rhodocyclaceae bacterium]